MAVKNANWSGPMTIAQILELLQTMEPQLIYEKDIAHICDATIRSLVEIYVPPNADELKNFRHDLVCVGHLLESIVKRAENRDQIIMSSLQTLYKLIVAMEKPSPAAGIIFNIYGEALPEAIKILMSNSSSNEFDNDIRRVITILCAWLRTFSDFSNLNKCIIQMLDGLADLKKINLLIDVSLSVIERLFLSLIIPCIRPNVLPVLTHILKSAQSLNVFEKIMSRIPKVLPAVESSIRHTSATDAEQYHFRQLVDIIFALMRKFPVFDNTYASIETTMEKFDSYASESYTILNGKSWEPVVTINTREPKTPIGLVNLGNTCYMNSVLQALFMTQKFTREILELRLRSRMIMSMQQLFALLLCSVRLELVPRDILQTRPQTFRYGHQQDSFEYLGYVLDQLHEEEKKSMINDGGSAQIDQSNGYESFLSDIDDKYIRNRQPDMEYDDWPENTIAKETEAASISADYIENTQCEPKYTDWPENVETKTTAADSMLTDADVDELDGVKCGPSETHGTSGATTSSQPSSKESTIIQRTFGGKMSVTYKCLNCLSTSTIVDNFFDLQLSFPHAIDSFTPHETAFCTTQSLLDTYFSPEKLTDDDKYYCDKCAALCDGERDISLTEGPSNLILVIKHFKYDRKFHVRRKLLNKVHHNDVITLTTADDANGQCVRKTYKLYAVIVHSGMNIDSGHYYTYGADHNGSWFKFNDSFVDRSSLSEIKSLSDLNTPYILFYELMSTETSNDRILKAEENVSNNVESQGRIAQEPATNFEWPNLSELPPMLQDFVRKDNLAYTHEFRRKNYSDDENVIRYNKHRKSDNDQDPPSSCGGNMIESSNRYIY